MKMRRNIVARTVHQIRQQKENNRIEKKKKNGEEKKKERTEIVTVLFASHRSLSHSSQIKRILMSCLWINCE